VRKTQEIKGDLRFV